MNTKLLKIGAFGIVLALTDFSAFAADAPLSPVSGQKFSALQLVKDSPTIKRMADGIISDDNLAARRALLQKRKQSQLVVKSLASDKQSLEKKLQVLSEEDHQKAIGLQYVKLIRVLTGECSKIVGGLMAEDGTAIGDLETKLEDIDQLRALDAILGDIGEDELLTEALNTINEVRVYNAEKKILMLKKVTDLEHGFIGVVRASVTVLASELVGKQTPTKTQDAILEQLRANITEVFEAMPKPRDVFIQRLKAVFAEEVIEEEEEDKKDQADQDIDDLEGFAK